MSKQTKSIIEFEDESLPEEIAYFHSLFFEVWDAYRGLTYRNILDWQELYGIRLTSDIIDMFKQIAGKANEFVRSKTEN